jgi:hypothetical protein
MTEPAPGQGAGASSQPDSEVPATGRAEPGPPPPGANQGGGTEVERSPERRGEAPPAAGGTTPSR